MCFVARSVSFPVRHEPVTVVPTIQLSETGQLG